MTSYTFVFALQSLAGWTFAFGSYYTLNITQFVDSPNMSKMADIVDPYSALKLGVEPSRFVFSLAGYLERYRKMKILQIQSSGDEFFLPDNEVIRCLCVDFTSPALIYVGHILE